jgi:TatD DNase family protein
MIPTLDAHAHLHPARAAGELAACGAVLSMTLSLDEAEAAAKQQVALITWGAGCHPRNLKAQAGFDALRFRSLLERRAVCGEIGLDGGSRVPLDVQLRTFRQELDVLRDIPRLASIHSYQATALVLEELANRPLAFPVLHWWTGSAAETRQAVSLGCYFSIHSQVSRQSKFRSWVPLERLLVESDHGYNDPPAAIPCRVEWVEFLVAQQYRVDVQLIRQTAWQNLAAIFQQTGTLRLLPEALAALLTTNAGLRWPQPPILGT